MRGGIMFSLGFCSRSRCRASPFAPRGRSWPDRAALRRLDTERFVRGGKYVFAHAVGLRPSLRGGGPDRTGRLFAALIRRDLFLEVSPHGLFPCPRALRSDSEELSGACAPPPRSGDFSRLRERKRQSREPYSPQSQPSPYQGGEEPPAPDGAPPRSGDFSRLRERKHKPERKRQSRE